MKIRDIIQPDSRIYVKSEFGPMSNEWPALSFSQKETAKKFSNVFRRGKDFVISIGTSNGSNTKDPAHRQSILSVISAEPRTPLETKTIVPKDSWRYAVEEYGIGRWEWSLPVEKAFTVLNYPKAHEVIPQTYRQLGNPKHFGRCVELSPAEMQSLLELVIEPVDIQLTQEAQAALDLNTTDESLKKEFSRLINLIITDIKRAGENRNGVYPPRRCPNISDLFQLLMQRWREQAGCCALCETPIPLEGTNFLLQMSRDRIDSENKSYDFSNLQITHLGCNLAKSEATTEQWNEYLQVVRRSLE